jgi:hypothetical protein
MMHSERNASHLTDINDRTAGIIMTTEAFGIAGGPFGLDSYYPGLCGGRPAHSNSIPDSIPIPAAHPQPLMLPQPGFQQTKSIAKN